MRLFVSTDFKQVEGDVVIDCINGIAMLEAVNASSYTAWIVDDADGRIISSFEAKWVRQAVSALEKVLQDAAVFLRYDSMASVRSYAGYTNAYKTEATAVAQWASKCWIYLEGQEVVMKTGTFITIKELIAGLPVLPTQLDGFVIGSLL